MTTVTDSQLAAKRAQLDAEAAEVDAALAQAVATKSFGQLGALEARIDQLSADRAELDQADARAKAFSSHPRAEYAGAASDENRGVVADTKAMKSGRGVSPLAISEASMKSLYVAASSRQSLAVKAFSTVEGLLPASRRPCELPRRHRLMQTLHQT